MAIWLKRLELILKFPIGLMLYLLSPSIRAAVRRKLRGANDTLHSGETVVVVLNNEVIE